MASRHLGQAKTAADFAHQAAEAAETARQGVASGNALALTKSIAHSAIVPSDGDDGLLVGDWNMTG